MITHRNIINSIYMITIKENDKPKLKNCKMKCDVPLDEKLDKYDLTNFLIVINQP